MANKLNFDDLSQLREEMKQGMLDREAKGPEIVVGMGTTGIAAGAREIMTTILTELGKRNLHIKVTQIDCADLQQQEPWVAVLLPDKEQVTYAKVDSKDMARIIDQHVVNGELVQELLVG